MDIFFNISGTRLNARPNPATPPPPARDLPKCDIQTPHAAKIKQSHLGEAGGGRFEVNSKIMPAKRSNPKTMHAQVNCEKNLHLPKEDFGQFCEEIKLAG